MGVQLVTFEAFRDLIKLLQLSISEETGIALADDENLEQRASAKSTAVGQYSQQSAQAAGRPAPGAPAGAEHCYLPDLCMVRQEEFDRLQMGFSVSRLPQARQQAL